MEVLQRARSIKLMHHRRLPAAHRACRIYTLYTARTENWQPAHREERSLGVQRLRVALVCHHYEPRSPRARDLGAYVPWHSGDRAEMSGQLSNARARSAAGSAQAADARSRYAAAASASWVARLTLSWWSVRTSKPKEVLSTHLSAALDSEWR